MVCALGWAGISYGEYRFLYYLDPKLSLFIPFLTIFGLFLPRGNLGLKVFSPKLSNYGSEGRPPPYGGGFQFFEPFPFLERGKPWACRRKKHGGYPLPLCVSTNLSHQKATPAAIQK